MNTHATPRGLPVRSFASGSHQPQPQREPAAAQVTNNEDYNSLAEEDREHIDEVVSARPPLSQSDKPGLTRPPVRPHGHEEKRVAQQL